MTIIHKVGRRKNAIARIYLKEGTGLFHINGKLSDIYFTTPLDQYKLQQVFILTNTHNMYDVNVNVYGGGTTGQVEAIRLAIARALVFLNQENREFLKPQGLLTRDSRIVERKKFGQKKARKKFQFSKR